jgi:hypothetical protein
MQIQKDNKQPKQKDKDTQQALRPQREYECKPNSNELKNRGALAAVGQRVPVLTKHSDYMSLNVYFATSFLG